MREKRASYQEREPVKRSNYIHWDINHGNVRHVVLDSGKRKHKEWCVLFICCEYSFINQSRLEEIIESDLPSLDR